MESIKILILEDVQFDAELIEYELRHENLNFSSVRVETEAEFIKELENYKPDVILADHSLPSFDGITALEITKKMSPQTPFIFVSGKIGDEFAVDMLKNGATDYVFKSNLKKLVPAIKRAIAELDELEELKKSKIQLQQALEEKEMLLKEIHHRVKNNLMIISSLLDLQSQHIKDKTDYDFFRESKNRADSMALIHERLYQSKDLKKIDFEDYVHTLAHELFNAYVIDSEIKLMLDVEDIMLDVNMAIPLGLIITELLTNSLKYAFSSLNNSETVGGKFIASMPYFKGSINGKTEDISAESLESTYELSDLTKKENIISIIFNKKQDKFTLIVKDNGIGFPDDLNFKNSDSLGLELITSLTKQINGDITFNNQDGTEFKITFKELEYTEII